MILGFLIGVIAILLLSLFLNIRKNKKWRVYSGFRPGYYTDNPNVEIQFIVFNLRKGLFQKKIIRPPGHIGVGIDPARPDFEEKLSEYRMHAISVCQSLNMTNKLNS